VVDRLQECRPTEVDCTSQPCSYPHQEPYSIEATARRCRSSTGAIPTTRTSTASYDSHLPEHLSTDALRPTPSFYLQGNNARLQLVPASTTTKANRANNSESAALQTAGVAHPSPPTTNQKVPKPEEIRLLVHWGGQRQEQREGPVS
jgi:hypothetical protein